MHVLLPLQQTVEKEEKENVVVFIDCNVCGVPGNTFQYCVSFLTIHLKGWCCTAHNATKKVLLSVRKCIKLIPNSEKSQNMFACISRVHKYYNIIVNLTTPSTQTITILFMLLYLLLYWKNNKNDY